MKKDQGMEALDRKAMLGPKFAFPKQSRHEPTEMADEIGISPSYLNLIGTINGRSPSHFCSSSAGL